MYTLWNFADEFTFENVGKVIQALAEHTHDNSPMNRKPSYVVGYDTRFLSDRYAKRVAEVLSANGIHVWLTPRDAPTPLISYATLDRYGLNPGEWDPPLHIQGAVMITASHNPPRYNGIKLKTNNGGAAGSEVSQSVVKYLKENEALEAFTQHLDLKEGMERNLVHTFDPFPAYKKHISKLIDFDVIRAAKPTVAIDAMYGAGRTYLSGLLEEAGCVVKEIRAEMNPGFNGIHPEPIARHLEPLADLMREGDYQIGLATDGDADRIGAMDVDGRFIDPHCIMALLLQYLVEKRGLTGSVVKTVSTTQMLNRLAERYGLTIYETPVGFNHIYDYMIKEDVLIGGEESGGISILGHIPEGDGILMGLLLVELVASTGKTLGTLVDELKENAPATLAGQTVAEINDSDGVKFILADNSWLLIRPSGTEPVLRIYAEARNEADVQTLLQSGVELADS